MEKRIKKHMDTLSDLDKLLLLRKSVNVAIKDFKAKDKSLKAEIEFGFNRTGVRGGKFTTLAANSQKNTEAYLKSLDLIKMIIKYCS